MDIKVRTNISNEFKDIKIKYGIKTTTEDKWSGSYSKLGLSFEKYKNMKQDIINMISQYKNSVVGIVMNKESCYTNKKEWLMRLVI